MCATDNPIMTFLTELHHHECVGQGGRHKPLTGVWPPTPPREMARRQEGAAAAESPIAARDEPLLKQALRFPHLQHLLPADRAVWLLIDKHGPINHSALASHLDVNGVPLRGADLTHAIARLRNRGLTISAGKGSGTTYTSRIAHSDIRKPKGRPKETAIVAFAPLHAKRLRALAPRPGLEDVSDWLLELADELSGVAHG